MNANTCIDELAAALALLKTGIAGDIEALAAKTADALENGKKILLMGNGGSASDAQHIAAEFVGRYKTRRGGLPAYSLCDNCCTLTAVGNDFSFEDVFARQIEALACEGDIVVAITTSGNSGNIIKAMKAARQKGCFVALLSGGDGGLAKAHADAAILAPSKNTPRIQECHILIGHIICEIAEMRLARQ
ncbi:MAG: SIS domain-containing protein [Elusimicrobiales bacterium]